jgi:hypothetical protein
MSAKKQNEDSVNLTPVFRLKPINKRNEAIVKYVGNLTDDEKLGDEVVTLDTILHKESCVYGNHAIPIDDIDKFELLGRIYRCNIVGSHLIASKRYPAMYLDVQYNRTMVSGSLFQIFISLDIFEDEKKSIKNYSEYVNHKFTGKWIRHIDCDDELRENYNRMIEHELQNDAFELIYKSDDSHYINLRNSLSDDEIMDWIDNYVANERSFYDSLINDTEIKFANIKTSRDEFVELCMSKKFNKFLKIAMKCREFNRRRKYQLEDSKPYTPPTSYTNINTLQNDLLKNGEIRLDDD